MDFANTLSGAAGSSFHAMSILPLAIAIVVPIIAATIVFCAHRRALKKNTPKKK